MHGIYISIPKTNHVSRVYSVAAILLLQFILHVMLYPVEYLYFEIGTYRNICAVSNMAFFL